MQKLTNPLDVYKFLPKTNCRQCNEQTCLAFAAAVIKGMKRLDKCPHLDRDVVQRYDIKVHKGLNIEEQQRQMMLQMKKEIARVDFAAAAERLGAIYAEGKLRIKVLGRDFVVSSQGEVTSSCHINAWVTIPVLKYVISYRGIDLSGTWVPFRELPSGMTWSPLYEQRCEKPLKKIADQNTELLQDLMDIFGGKTVENSSFPDISSVLFPLPKFPVYIGYRKPDDDTDSQLSIFFDSTAEDNLGIECIYLLVAGLVVMLEKISYRHG